MLFEKTLNIAAMFVSGILPSAVCTQIRKWLGARGLGRTRLGGSCRCSEKTRKTLTQVLATLSTNEKTTKNFWAFYIHISLDIHILFYIHISLDIHILFYLRITILNFPKVIGSKYSTSIFGFRATQLWNQVPDSIRNEPNAKCFKAKLTRNWQQIKCTCTSCK